MRSLHILAITAAVLIAAPTLRAQAPAAPATGAATPPATPGAPATAPAAKAKPLSSGEAKGITDLLEAMHFHIRMGEVAKHKDKEDKDVVAFGNKSHKEMTEQYTPLVNLAMLRQMDNKNIPTAVTKGDKSDIEKLSKAKPEKWKLEYYELFAKQGKQNVRVAEAAVKSFADPELKDLGTKVAATITAQTAAAEAAHKELKAKK